MNILTILSLPVHGHRVPVFKFCSSEFCSFSTTDFKHILLDVCLIIYSFIFGAREGNGTPLQYSCLENPMNGGAWWAAVQGVAESRT